MCKVEHELHTTKNALQIAELEDRWSLDVESGKGGIATTNASRSGSDIGGSKQSMASMLQLMAQGNAYRIANPGLFGLYAFAYTTALYQVSKLTLFSLMHIPSLVCIIG